MQVGLNIPHVGPPHARRHRDLRPHRRRSRLRHPLGRRPRRPLHRDGESGRCPYSESGAIGIRPTVNFLEPLATLMYVAGLTERIQLGTAVLVLPMREPVLHAKLMASLDFLSNGRFICGAGVGWWKEEFEVLGVPFERRGKRMDECLTLLRALWTDEFVEFKGEFYLALQHPGRANRRRRPRRSAPARTRRCARSLPGPPAESAPRRARRGTSPATPPSTTCHPGFTRLRRDPRRVVEQNLVVAHLQEQRRQTRQVRVQRRGRADRARHGPASSDRRSRSACRGS